MAIRIVHVRPSERFSHCWEVAERQGAQPVFGHRSYAISYAKRRFGGNETEIHVHDETGGTVTEVIKVQRKSNTGEPQQAT